MAVVISAVIVFPVVIVALTLALMAAETRLKPRGKIKITINGDPEKAIEADAGGTLLNTLSNAGVLLPSACGGGGTCGVCKCQVTAGGGDILPTEQSHINYGEAKKNWRLSCQVKVREDMEIRVPDEVFSINKWECDVITNDSVATYIREFTLKLPEGENLNFQSGGYIQIEAPPFEADFKDFGIEEDFLEEWTKLGVLDTLHEISIATAYRTMDGTLQEFPADTWRLGGVEPVYETVPGWQTPTHEARTLEELPSAARHYLARLEELTDTPVQMVSVGTRRSQIIKV